MPGYQRIGALEIALVGKAAGDDPPLVPPFPRIDEKGGIAGSLVEKCCRLLVFLLASQDLDPDAQEGGIVGPGRIHRLDQRLGIAGIADQRAPGVEQRLRLAKVGEALGLADAAAIEQVVHPALVVLYGQKRREFLQDTVLEPLVERFGGPDIADGLRGFVRPPRLAKGAGKKDRAFRRLRGLLGEGCKYGVSVRVFPVERAFRTVAQAVEARPAGQFVPCRGDFARWNAGARKRVGGGKRGYDRV